MRFDGLFRRINITVAMSVALTNVYEALDYRISEAIHMCVRIYSTARLATPNRVSRHFPHIGA